jgi:H+-transporting ATPase
MNEDPKSLSLPELQAKLGSSPDGLRQAEAQRRLAQYGYNDITDKRGNPFLKFLSYFWGPIPWMIEVAVILSALVRHWPDLFVILVLLLANAAVGFWEEYQAGNASAALKAQLAIRARIRRDGKWSSVAARELAPGRRSPSSRQAGCAHVFCSRPAMAIPSYQCIGWAYFPPLGGK